MWEYIREVWFRVGGREGYYEEEIVKLRDEYG